MTPDPTQSPSEWVPAFEGQRPPFAPGNDLAVKSGMWSARLVDPVAAQFVQAATTDDAVPYLREPRYGPALQAWAKAEARVQLLEEWVSGMSIEHAAESAQGKTPPLEILRKWEATASTHRDKLGLTPLAASRLGRNVAATRQHDTAAIMAELHRLEQDGHLPGGAA